ncbi:MAG: hypothetical protein ABEI86_09065 [Halobacteriaceae archaeon]
MSNVDRIESASNVILNISQGASASESNDSVTLKIPISNLDRTKDIEITQHREGSIEANGYSVDSISYDGSMAFKGPTVRGPDGQTHSIEDVVYGPDNLVPKPCTITITHSLEDESDNTETLEDVLVVSDSYKVESESATETTFDWVAMSKS